VKLEAIDRRLKLVEARAVPTTEEVAALRTELGSLDPTKLQSLIATAETYGGFTKRVEVVEADLANLKRILNPSDPSTLLAIPRLQDKFDDLTRQITTMKADVASFRSDYAAEAARLEIRVKNDVDRVVDMVKWLLLLLVPLAFTTFKDVFKKKGDDDGSPKKAA
jgi:hypothetical protein